MKIAIITSTRADWGLLHPLVNELSQRGEKPIIIATYAHLFPEMGDTIQELVEDGFPPAMSVPARRPPQEAVADTVTGFHKAFSFLQPDIAVILGDRVEMLGVATAALLMNIPIAHIAGGTVSEGAVDDSIRNAISQMAALHFPETDKGARKLEMMGAKPGQIFVAGALGVFNAVNVPEISVDEIGNYIGFELGPEYLLGTFHPETRGSDKTPIQQMQIWIEGLEEALRENEGLKMLLTFPNTDTDPTALMSLLYTFAADHRDRVKVVPSLGRVRYINAARHATVVAGNSSSGIVEIPSLGVPVIDVGIRQKGRQRSKAVLHADLDWIGISKAIKEALSPMARLRAEEYPNPYFKENTPKIIADAVLNSGQRRQ